MGNKKHIIIAAVLALFCTTGSFANAQDISLTQMDVKKSSVSDSVDVTFYTTGQSTNSVVTRKSNNKYVVLLPNISSTSSVAPSLGGVKDLISDVEVKHVNDGIGGYTKVTFSTVKPIRIKTYTKRSNPVTAVQNDYKNLIAQNNTKPAVAEKPQATTQKPAQPQPQAKPVVTQSKSEKPVSNKVTKPAETKKEKPAVQKNTTKTVQKTKPVVADTPKVAKVEPAKKPVETKSAASVPKLEEKPQVNNVVKNEAPAKVEKTEVKETPKAQENNTKSHKLPLWLLIAGGSALVMGVLSVVNAIAKDMRRRKSLESFFAVNTSENSDASQEKYTNIVNDINLNWQEKYKRYNEVSSEEKENSVSGISYITNLGASTNSIISTDASEVVGTIADVEEISPVQKLEIKEKPVSGLFSKVIERKPINNISIKDVSENTEEEFKDQMRAKISQLEHSLAQTTSLNAPEENFGEVKSEDNSIISKTSDVKLKTFSKRVTLKEANRGLVSFDKAVKPLQEGRFVKLKDSPLSISRRSSVSSQITPAGLLSVGSKYLQNNGEIKMTRENEKYLLASLDEYLSILDSEPSSKTIADTLSQIRSAGTPMSRSGITNPISRASNPISRKASLTSPEGMIIKSGYNIDSEQGFYLVNMDGVSVLVGRIKDNTYILKKFDRIVEDKLQVRKDDENVYIVKVGKYKSLIDVSKNKMGTLLEI